MQKTQGVQLGKTGKELVQFLEDNADAFENQRYMKYHEADEAVELKHQLSDISIQINDIEIEKKEQMEVYKDLLKPLFDKKSSLLTEIKDGAKWIEEGVFKFVDHDTNEVGYYSNQGQLISSRPVRPDEKQRNIFKTSKYEVKEAI